MKRMLIVVSASLLISCAASTQTAPPAAPVPSEALRAMIAVQMLDRNAVHLLCDQNGYRSCFGQDLGQCQATLTPHREYCVAQTRDAFKTLPVTELEVKQYSGTLVSCMAMRHILDDPASLRHRSECLKNLTSVMDKEQVQRSLQK